MKVNALFTRIARRYNLINDLQSLGLHRLWKRRLVRLANLGPGQKALDLCCGTGDITFRLATTGAEAVGLDFSEPMLAVAKERLRHLQHKQHSYVGTIHFQPGDALHAPFPAGTFDAVTIGYGLRNLASWREGLAEMMRLTKPGGRVLVLDFGKPANPVWRFLYFGYLRFMVPLLGLLCCGDHAAYAYILESLKHFPAQDEVAARMRELGLQDLKVENILAGAMSINYGRRPARAAL